MNYQQKKSFVKKHKKKVEKNKKGKNKNKNVKNLIFVFTIMILFLFTGQIVLGEESLDIKKIDCYFDTQGEEIIQEKISFTPLFTFENFFEEEQTNQTNIFRVRRENYSIYPQTRTIKYNLSLFIKKSTSDENISGNEQDNHKTIIIDFQEISRNINSFTSTNTGIFLSKEELEKTYNIFCEDFLGEEEYEPKIKNIGLKITICDQDIFWTYNMSNYFENELNENDTSNNIFENNTYEGDYDEENNTQENNNDSAQDFSLEENIDVNIFSKQNIFMSGEQTNIEFYVSNQTSFKNVTYWIEDVRGKLLKAPHTSTNLQTKQHTWRNIEHPQIIGFLQARFCFEEGCLLSKNMIGIYEDISEEEEQEQDEQNSQEENNKISIQKIEIEKRHNIFLANIQVELKRVSGLKQVVVCNIRNDKDIRITPEMKFSLRTHGRQEVSISAPLFSLPQEIYVLCEGLDTQDSKTVTSPKELVKEANSNDDGQEEKSTTSNIKKEDPLILSFFTRTTKLHECILFYSRLEPMSGAEVIIKRNNEKKEGEREENILMRKNISIEQRETISIELCNLSNYEELELFILIEGKKESKKEVFMFEGEEEKNSKEISNLTPTHNTPESIFELVKNVEYENEDEKRNKKIIYILLSVILISISVFSLVKWDLSRNNSFIKQIILKYKT